MPRVAGHRSHGPVHAYSGTPSHTWQGVWPIHELFTIGCGIAQAHPAADLIPREAVSVHADALCQPGSKVYLLLQEEVFLQATGAAHGADQGASICVGDVASTIQARVSRDLAAASTPTAALSSGLPFSLAQRLSDQPHSSHVAGSNGMGNGLKEAPSPAAASPASSDDDGLLLQPATPGRSPDGSVHGKGKGSPAQQAAQHDKMVDGLGEVPQPASAFGDAAAGPEQHSAEHFAAKAPAAETMHSRLSQSLRFLGEMLRKRARIAGKP